MPISNPANFVNVNVSDLQTNHPICFPGGRLTLSATNPIADVSGATTFYYLPYAHGVVPFWNNALSVWEYRPIPEAGLSLTRPTENPRIVDVFATTRPNEPNTFGMDIQSWTNDTTRFIPMFRKNGVPVVAYTGGETPLRTYLGSIRFVGSNGAATMMDTVTQRFVFNAHNRVKKRVLRYEPTFNWTYTGTPWRQWNNSSLNRIEIVDGIGSELLDLTFTARAICPANVYAQYGLGVDTNANVTDSYINGNGDQTVVARLSRVLGLGYHYCQAMESVATPGTPTFFGQGYLGLQGTWQC
ncbi:MAG: hypothetical protein HC827_12010 [Cyanobacteria bacterium RM1_2_2]|nr:hypothetical protein [Cyanobacteria bacterium RM1_2_2]